jgi:hypothetical protein
MWPLEKFMAINGRYLKDTPEGSTALLNTNKKLGEILVEKNLLTPEKLNLALTIQKQDQTGIHHRR